MEATKIAKKIAKDVSKTKGYADGTIITWGMRGINGVLYTYAAVAAKGSWYTTATQASYSIDKVMTSTDLMRKLGDSNVEYVRVASEFVEVEL